MGFGYERFQLVVSGAAPAELENLLRLRGIVSASTSESEDHRVEIELTVERCTDAIPRAIAAIVEAGGSVWSCAAREHTLDEVFQLVVRGNATPTPEAKVAS
jgi:hypothetical protein